jgi:hypothetical protein
MAAAAEPVFTTKFFTYVEIPDGMTDFSNELHGNRQTDRDRANKSEFCFFVVVMTHVD